MPCTAMTFSFLAPVLSAQGTTASTPTARDILPMFGRYTVFPAMALGELWRHGATRWGRICDGALSQ